MQIKTILGGSIIFILSFLPMVVWFTSSPDAINLNNYSSITHGFGEIFGLVGMTMFALTFILSMRLKKIEELFNGLDKVYVVHAILGSLALFFILLHPIFLVLKFIPSNFYLAAKYLLPSSAWSINFGIIALIGILSLIALTFFVRMRYEKWKFSHKFLGLVFIFAVAHIFLVRMFFVTDGIFPGYYAYAFIVSIIGLSGFFYTLFIKKVVLKKYQYTISSINKLKNVFEISMIPKSEKMLYNNGQFAFFSFENINLPSEPHPFSLASKSNDREIKIFVKKLGDFTSSLDSLKLGNSVYVEGPYGKFSHTKKNIDQVWVAGGIGITPFVGMALDLQNQKSNNKTYLIYTAKEDIEFICKEKFKEISSENKNFKVLFWNSQEKGYLNLKHISEFVGNLKNKEYFLCGPSVFKEKIIEELVKNKVNKNNIHEEEFEFK